MSYERSEGAVKLSVSAWALLWSVFIVVVAGLAFVVRLDAKVETLIRQQADDHRALQEHVSAPGHPVGIERDQSAVERIKKLEESSARTKP